MTAAHPVHGDDARAIHARARGAPRPADSTPSAASALSGAFPDVPRHAVNVPRGGRRSPLAGGDTYLRPDGESDGERPPGRQEFRRDGPAGEAAPAQSDPSSSSAGAPRARVPFPVVDEITRHCLADDEPETVHIEIHLPGRPDPDRLRTAVGEALRQHPRILMRQTSVRWGHRRYHWELTGVPDHDPVSFPGGTLAEGRRRALTHCPPLNASPPVRIEVVAHQGSWVLLATINHTALDGPACLRVLATAAELYGGADNSPAPPPVRTAAAPGPPGHEPAPPGGSAWQRPARIAAQNPRPDLPGNGMSIAELPVPARPPRTPERPAAYTVNDQLLVATWLMSARWNRMHGRPVRPVRITMPVDDRPRTAEMPIGNGTRLVEVTFGPEERELYDRLTATGGPDPVAVARMLRATSARTRALKALDRPQLGFSGSLLTSPLLPVGVRAAYTRALRTAAGPWTSTTLLSNIGRVPYPLDFGEAGRATAVWFSAPARAPRGLSVTTVSTGGRLQLALRWSHARLDDAAGDRLGELFTESLSATAYDASVWPEGGAA